MCIRCATPAIAEPKLRRRAFCAGVLAASAMTAGAASAGGGLLEPRLRLRGASPPGARRVALTLDACPGGFDRRIATYLADNGIAATIFLTSAWIARNPAGLEFLLSHRDLFAFENHGARHIPAVLGTRSVYGLRPAGDLEGVHSEVDVGASDIRQATGSQPRWYRGATALYSPAAIEFIRAMGFAIAGFSLNADMGASLPAAGVASRMAGAKDGDVIIGHLTQPNRPSGLGIIAGVTELQRQGIEFVHLDPSPGESGAS